jgi:hypothetical protein
MIADEIFKRFNNFKLETSGVYSVESLCCGVGKSLFSKNKNQSFLYNCKVCGCVYRWYPDIEPHDNLRQLIETLSDIPVKNQEIVNTIFSTNHIEPITKNNQYLECRKLDISDWYFYTSSDTMLKDYLIIPVNLEDMNQGMICRYMGSNPNLSRYINIMNDPILLDNSKKTDNFNLIFEGSIDALLLNGIAILDSFMTEDQISKINKKKKKNIVVPDRDRGGRSMALKAIDLGWSVSFPDMPIQFKDPAEAIQAGFCDRASMRKNILNSVYNGKEARNILLSWRDSGYI